MNRHGIIFKILLLILTASLLISSLIGCGENEVSEETIKLSFKSAAKYDYLKSIDGKKITINGYIATSSPVDGSFIFLMNLPYQSCPFCVPNTSQLSNTIEVYPKEDDSFPFTNQAIKVVGTLVVAPSEDEPFKDNYGYTFNYKIVDADYTVLSADELSSDMALWQKIANSDVVNEIYKMYDYVNFVCLWNTYYVKSYTDKDGKLVPGYYLWPADAERYITTDGSQYNYGYKDGYFDSIVNKIEAIDKEAFADLIKNVRDAETLAKKAYSELKAGNYTFEEKYLELFGTTDKVYSLNKGEELKAEMNEVFSFFSTWLASWEL